MWEEGKEGEAKRMGRISPSCSGLSVFQMGDKVQCEIILFTSE